MSLIKKIGIQVVCHEGIVSLWPELFLYIVSMGLVDGLLENRRMAKIGKVAARMCLTLACGGVFLRDVAQFSFRRRYRRGFSNSKFFILFRGFHLLTVYEDFLKFFLTIGTVLKLCSCSVLYESIHRKKVLHSFCYTTTTGTVPGR